VKQAALLRGINVGGKNRLPMKGLAEIFTKAGCRDVATYIQSGNVVFTAPAPLLKKIPTIISDEIEKQFGFPVPIVIRSHDELNALTLGNPYLKAGEPEKTLHVVFLSGSPHADAIAKLDPMRSPPDRFIVTGSHIYLHAPAGLGRSKITNAWLDSKLSTISTARNWATVLKLHEMTRQD
jgi:uncharacterized protein (DUF1697 family)